MLVKERIFIKMRCDLLQMQSIAQYDKYKKNKQHNEKYEI